ncbi:shikimate dehydrogenase [Chondromyces apiculatus]|uniref:Shikimate dehydrogenase (NADP(+)) n=1 Tax=Chondromyces apiculatus DSM 436 TaxID=1192034 RepID=A0A017T7K6_9BACT|nr:shikimate dehydrogenase [Chondromyces apiculatus]EYF05253.1 Shikimate 5-dehydrogenase I alpha [Chondromyces apiculatus DSM 436]
MAERRLFVLIGHPVRHSVSPVMHTAAFRALHLPHIYSAFDVPTEDDLRQIVDEVRSGVIAGANVTVPHKQRVLSMVDAVDESAASIGAANVLVRTPDRRVIAYNTDALALQDELDDLLKDTSPPSVRGKAGAPPAPVRSSPGQASGQASSFQPAAALGVIREPHLQALPCPRGRAVIIGAGGAGLAAIMACKRLGFHLISVTTRSWASSAEMLDSPSAERARALGALTAPWPVRSTPILSKASQMLKLNWSETAATADLILQATSAGMLGGPPGEDVTGIVPWDMLAPHARAYDVIYNPPVTPFLRMSGLRGLKARDGLGMVVGQAARSFTLWTGMEAPVELMRSAAEESLEKATSVR